VSLTYKEKHFASFFDAPFRIRDSRSPFVSAFKADLKKSLSTKNPMFRSEDDFTYYSVFKDDKLVARITAHVHHAFNEKYKTKKAYFGFFECVNDQSVADYTLSLAEAWAKKNNYTSISGSFNLTAMQEMGIMINGFDNPPYIAQSYSERYYHTLLERAGYKAIFPMSTFEVDLQKVDPTAQLTDKGKQVLSDNTYEFRNVTSSNYKQLLPVLSKLFNESFSHNDLFVPISEEEFNFQANDLALFLDDHLTFIAYNKGMPVGISIHLPDINIFLRSVQSRFGIGLLFKLLLFKLKKQRAMCLFSAVIPEYQNKGVLSALAYLSTDAMKKRGYKTFGITWIADSNIASLKKMEHLGATRMHDLRIFEKTL
jgi:hypothetical protein